MLLWYVHTYVRTLSYYSVLFCLKVFLFLFLFSFFNCSLFSFCFYCYFFFALCKLLCSMSFWSGLTLVFSYLQQRTTVSLCHIQCAISIQSGMVVVIYTFFFFFLYSPNKRYISAEFLIFWGVATEILFYTLKLQKQKSLQKRVVKTNLSNTTKVSLSRVTCSRHFNRQVEIKIVMKSNI